MCGSLLPRQSMCLMCCCCFFHCCSLLHPELRSFLQTLLDLLQRAEDYIRDKVDLTFFTQTLPQLVEHIYSTAFAHTRERRDLGLAQTAGTHNCYNIS